MQKAKQYYLIWKNIKKHVPRMCKPNLSVENYRYIGKLKAYQESKLFHSIIILL